MEEKKNKILWALIDKLAADNGLTASGLARRAKLDATTFNPGKRMTASGNYRSVSVSSVFKVCAGLNITFTEFAQKFDTMVAADEAK